MSNDLQKWIDEQTGLTKLYVHDFKNPVSAISANLSYLEAVLPDAEEDVLGAVQDSSVAMRMLLHMLDNFLQISRLESRELSESVPVPLDRFMDETISRLRKMFTSPEPRLTVQGKVPEKMCSWPAAYARLAVENLLLQALHNTPASGSVAYHVALEDGMVVFTVTDTGVAIAPEYYDVTFTRDFQHVAKSNEHARYGRAMAMYAVGLAAEVLGGSVRVEKVNDRQQFVLKLPVEIEMRPS
jgi:two-component system, OmpR family, sensor histidine kinase BaeS